MAADTEMRDILIALRQQVQDGFANINTKLDNMERKHEGHELRLRSLENEAQTRLTYIDRFQKVETTVQEHEGRFKELQGAGRGATLVTNIGRVVIGIVIGAVGIFGFQLSLAPKKPPVATAQTTITVPVPPQ
ncbi:hypothetical protein HT136_08505 [Novosphingobium profundi]|uniref:hypothetical protein n=1 Tax=Novosphingobium profundi TaxID=1774954 RepID=UPI001BD972AA|nr:hypothetical protein [Novosphingobium profundi]MBT0668409.1 hypothetical protein [Novosphingobium profundi]